MKIEAGKKYYAKIVCWDSNLWEVEVISVVEHRFLFFIWYTNVIVKYGDRLRLIDSSEIVGEVS
jgi:hypothetical protein